MGNNIYLPIEDFNEHSCYSFISSDIIRAYKDIPTTNSTIDFTDFYINSHYLINYGTESFSQDSILPTCIEKERLTNAYSYRNDFADIMLIVMCFSFIVGFIIHKLVKQLFKRWR